MFAVPISMSSVFCDFSSLDVLSSIREMIDPVQQENSTSTIRMTRVTMVMTTAYNI